MKGMERKPGPGEGCPVSDEGLLFQTSNPRTRLSLYTPDPSFTGLSLDYDAQQGTYVYFCLKM